MIRSVSLTQGRWLFRNLRLPWARNEHWLGTLEQTSKVLEIRGDPSNCLTLSQFCFYLWWIEIVFSGCLSSAGEIPRRTASRCFDAISGQPARCKKWARSGKQKWSTRKGLGSLGTGCDWVRFSTMSHTSRQQERFPKYIETALKKTQLQALPPKTQHSKHSRIINRNTNAMHQLGIPKRFHFELSNGTVHLTA